MRYDLSMSDKNIIDLHCHTSCSDGSLSTCQLLELAAKNNIYALSITDHDTIGAYKEAFDLASKLSIKIIPGIEFSAHHDDTSIHVLAYSFCLESPDLAAFCQKHQARRGERNLIIIDKLRKNGMPVEEVDLQIHENLPPLCIGRPHIAQAMVKRGYVSSISEAFNCFIGEGLSCYHPGVRFSVEETLDVIKKANGLSVIAHPHLIHDFKVEESLLQMPFDGIEVYYARFNQSQNLKWLNAAKKRGLMITGGSDFHGFAKPHIHLGCASAPEDTFNFLKEHYDQQRILR
jgi:predicted metal-dependent phosphoesterase TrpH